MGKVERDLLKYYKEKSKDYFSNIRLDIIKIMPSIENAKVLEIGAGEGNTLIKLKELGLAKEVVGIDIVELEHSNQKNPLIDKFIIGDIEKIDLNFPLDYFDIIICADVLEHLYDPWNVVKKLSLFLKPFGFLIASIPNIGYYKILKKIIIDKDFKYENSGILDKTHLRFFCKKNIINLFEDADLKVLKILSTFELDKRTKSYLFNKITFRIFKDLLTDQYLIISQKTK